MNYKLLLLCGLGLASQYPAQAQVGLFAAGLLSSGGGPMLTQSTTRYGTYPMQRTPKAALGIVGGDQIAYLERQLDECRGRLQHDSLGSVCSAAQLQQLQTTLAVVGQAQRKWPLQPYTDEIAFYAAQEARRRAAAAK